MQRILPPQKWIQPPLKPGAAAGAAFVANIGAAVAQIRANARGAALGRDPEYLHLLRVGIRRLRSTLRAFRELVRRRRAQRFDRELRSALRSLGAARDWDVFHGSHRHAGLRRHARGSTADARRVVRATVASAWFQALPVSVLAWAKASPWKSGADPREPMAGFAPRALDRLQRRLIEVADEIDWRDPARRHRLRIRVKRLRYGCECFAAAWPESTMLPFLKKLRRLQEILGAMNDIQVQRRLLRDLARGSGPAAAAAQAALRARERVLAAMLSRAWTAFKSIWPYWTTEKKIRGDRPRD
jgi:CHAD domain-containing protein